MAIKNTYYFPHDYHARHDPKLERLRMEVGPVGDGIFWGLVEMLYEENGYLNIKDIPLYSKMLNADEHMLNKVITDLFLTDGDRFYNKSLLDRLEHINNVREERRAAGELSGKARQKNACSTNDEQLRNNIKERDKRDKRDIYPSRFEEFWALYPKPIGMSVALMTFMATVKTDKDFEDLKAALKNYLASDEVKKGFIKNGSNWIEDWRGWLNQKPKKADPLSKFEVRKE